MNTKNVTLDNVILWIDRWRGYIDDDMILRMKIAAERDLPIEDLRDNYRATWDPDPEPGKYHCSRCNVKVDVSNSEQPDGAIATLNFCYNCGAAMGCHYFENREVKK